MNIGDKIRFLMETDLNAPLGVPALDQSGKIQEHLIDKISVSKIYDFPTSLPANGGNADTIDGKHIEETIINNNNNLVAVFDNGSIKAIRQNELNITNVNTANIATMLGTETKGSAVKPIYLKSGVPTECMYTIEKSVPADALFTDTVYTHPNSGVSAGTYRSVTVNAQGHVTGGSNPVVTVEQGGTGKTTAVDAANMFINSLSVDISNILPNDYIIAQHSGGGNTNKTYYRKPISALWDYINNKTGLVYANISHAHDTISTVRHTNRDDNNDTNNTKMYYYEGADISTANLPHSNVFVLHSQINVARAMELGIRWDHSSPQLWCRTRHDTWSNWMELGLRIITGSFSGNGTSVNVEVGTSTCPRLVVYWDSGTGESYIGTPSLDNVGAFSTFTTKSGVIYKYTALI